MFAWDHGVVRVDVLSVGHRARRDVGAPVGVAVLGRAAPLSGSARQAGAGAEAVHMAGEESSLSVNLGGFLLTLVQLLRHEQGGQKVVFHHFLLLRLLHHSSKRTFIKNCHSWCDCSDHHV